MTWSDPDIDPESCDAIVAATAWDYAERPAEFLERLQAWSKTTPVLNPVPTIQWNFDKRYLRDLAGRGVPIVNTIWADEVSEEGIAAAFEQLCTDELVVKPVVGQHSWRQARIKRGTPLPPADQLPPAGAMLQPFLPSIQEEGELSFLCIDRTFSHALRKRPAEGDYRIQSSFGGREERHTPRSDELALVSTVLESIEGPLLYARVDLIRDADGAWALMELEVIEPYLYPEQGEGREGVGQRFAHGLARLVGELCG